MKVSHRWLAIAGVAAAAATASGATLLHHRSEAGPSWTSAHAMAEQAHCSDTSQRAAAFAGTRDTGHCEVEGQRVDFVVVDDGTTAAPGGTATSRATATPTSRASSVMGGSHTPPTPTPQPRRTAPDLTQPVTDLDVALIRSARSSRGAREAHGHPAVRGSSRSQRPAESCPSSGRTVLTSTLTPTSAARSNSAPLSTVRPLPSPVFTALKDALYRSTSRRSTPVRSHPAKWTARREAPP